ncbi:uncharacterized protein LOC121681678 [Alosa sapidissima]|uniref:uncharacterized protein LOC121681678 n=1 Tax=Alosa sapidissima TaxID=34773 RepID=UPI001C0A4914|nr:uncharacterized protein LOC121681678 [Alosa sapidissima]
MFRLFHFICTVACVAASMQIYEMCPGTSFYIPHSPEYDPKTSDLYFTPQSGPSARVMVLNKTQPTDSHYMFKDETLFIFELRESDTGIFSWSNHNKFHTILKLVIKDCAEPKVVVFGNQLKLNVPPEAVMLEFVRASDQRKATIWPSSLFNVSKGYIQESYWYQQITYADRGFYTFRKTNLAELSKIQVIVTANVQYLNLDEEDRLEIYVPIAKASVSVDFTALEGKKYTVISNGYATEEGTDHFHGRIKMTSRSGGSAITVTDLQRSDAGRYQIFDGQGNLLAVWLLRQYSATSYYVYLFALIPVVLVILLSVCVKKCCCKNTKSSPTSNPAAASSEPMPYNAVEIDEPAPTNRTVTPHPVDTGPAEATPSAPSASSALGSSSDHQPQYQLKGFDSSAGDFLTTSTLSMDNAAANGDTSVYSSNKLTW